MSATLPKKNHLRGGCGQNREKGKGDLTRHRLNAQLKLEVFKEGGKGKKVRQKVNPLRKGGGRKENAPKKSGHQRILSATFKKKTLHENKEATEHSTKGGKKLPASRRGEGCQGCEWTTPLLQKNDEQVEQWGDMAPEGEARLSE